MNEEIQQQQLEAVKKMAIRKILTKEAVERLARIKLVKPELANNLELYLLQLYQAGKIKGEVSDEQLKLILDALTSKKEYKVLR